MILSQIAGILDKDNMSKVVLYQERQRKIVYKMTSARIKYILLGWVGESFGGKGGIKEGRRNL